MWYGPVKLDDKLSQNIPEISHKYYRENHRNLRSGIDNKGKKLVWEKHPERYIPGRFTATIIICNSEDATQLHNQEMDKRIQTY